MVKKRDDYIGWDSYFMGVAMLAAQRSKDPNTQVGACIVSKDKKILSTGYNGAPNHFNDDSFPWNREGEPLETKYMFVCHAEANAIDNFRGYKKEFEGARIYVDLFPCNECAKKIIQSGIQEVIYLSDKYSESDSTKASKILFDTCGVKYRQMDKKHQKEFKISLKPDTTIEYV